MGPITTLTPLTPSPTFDAFTEGDANHWPSGLIYSLQATTYRRTTRYHALMFRPHAQQAQQKWVEPWVFGRPLRGSAAGAECPRRSPSTLVRGSLHVKDFAGMNISTAPPSAFFCATHPRCPPRCVLANQETKYSSMKSRPCGTERAGDFRTYGPTLAVDRLLFERGKWTLQPVENP